MKRNKKGKKPGVMGDDMVWLQFQLLESPEPGQSLTPGVSDQHVPQCSHVENYLQCNSAGRWGLMRRVNATIR